MRTSSTAILAITFAILLVTSTVAGITAPVSGGLAAPDEPATAGNDSDTATTDGSSTSTDTTNTTSDTATAESTSDGTAEATLSVGTQARLDDAGSGERIPVIVVFSQQPDDRLSLQSMSGSEARAEMQSLAADTQASPLDYLETETTRGNVADVTSLYLTNAISLEANEKVIANLAGRPNVEKIVLDSKVSAFDGSGSGLYELWDDGNQSVAPSGFQRVSSGERADSINAIGADAVQESGITGKGVNVSVIDGGIDDDHPALEGQVVLRKDFTNSTASGTDPYGHGTHVAGTIAGRPDVQRAVGVAPGSISSTRV